MRSIAAAMALVAATCAPAHAAERPCYRHVRSAAQRELVRRESSGSPHARNRRSTAFGCLQLLRATRNAMGRRLGINPDTTSAAQQMRMGSLYIDLRYGTDHAALAHHDARGWY